MRNRHFGDFEFQLFATTCAVVASITEVDFSPIALHAAECAVMASIIGINCSSIRAAVGKARLKSYKAQIIFAAGCAVMASIIGINCSLVLVKVEEKAQNEDFSGSNSSTGPNSLQQVALSWPLSLVSSVARSGLQSEKSKLVAAGCAAVASIIGTNCSSIPAGLRKCLAALCSSVAGSGGNPEGRGVFAGLQSLRYAEVAPANRCGGSDCPIFDMMKAKTALLQEVWTGQPLTSIEIVTLTVLWRPEQRTLPQGVSPN
ncbi:hypothetical protein TREMEDRAFT_65255 [Tremella mesenterica DSM 1558]|uniref:uncharacterized protein n=1 Tax=Tremella mesenterica (strain ATCC 24925 / CBS 8224 / DSM 1558 / NBRC 9311 / NRRL Y-6157 / RJB 2259-6 / UBC 559-6) TaxID=578456 RepID=UPI00032BD881|nr:uncharacterized protein TREMEDRAFT_65255 [Tremella mesenterica DSM 1558]EIW66848.1 hypothetical protein TREMEDRAFT_65255 [Tremella mesenterica DSM 1558]